MPLDQADRLVAFGAGEQTTNSTSLVALSGRPRSTRLRKRRCRPQTQAEALMGLMRLFAIRREGSHCSSRVFRFSFVYVKVGRMHVGVKYYQIPIVIVEIPIPMFCAKHLSGFLHFALAFLVRPLLAFGVKAQRIQLPYQLIDPDDLLNLLR